MSEDIFAVFVLLFPFLCIGTVAFMIFGGFAVGVFLFIFQKGKNRD